jgi:hypothetical protein
VGEFKFFITACLIRLGSNLLAHITGYCEFIFTCEHAGLAVRLEASCFCTTLNFLFTFESFSEMPPPGIAVVFSWATLVWRGIVNVGVDGLKL